MSNKRHLPHIKLFEINSRFRRELSIEQEVNQFVIETFSRTGDIPQIHHSGDFISVMWNELEETTYVSPERPRIGDVERVNSRK